jgi:hypothetical protein
VTHRATAAALFLLALTAVPIARAAASVTPADDGYHYADWADGAHDATYTEWWYFNVVDANAGVRAIFTYFVADPGSLLGPARVQVVAAAYTAGGTVTAIDAYPADAFAASTRQADVVVGSCRIEVIDPDTYRINGASLDGRIVWDLRYVRAAASWFAADRMPVGRLPWESMSWLVYMPRAQVSGRLSVDGHLYEVAGGGYHDHNWGEWIPTDALWSWAQYGSPELTVELGDFQGQTGVASITTGGEQTVFAPGQYTFTNTRWAFDPAERVWYPTESLLTADDGHRRLRVVMSVIDTVALRGELAFPLPDVIIFEQTARYQGWLWTRGHDGRWRLETTFSGEGFKEYAAKHY